MRSSFTRSLPATPTSVVLSSCVVMLAVVSGACPSDDPKPSDTLDATVAETTADTVADTTTRPPDTTSDSSVDTDTDTSAGVCGTFAATGELQPNGNGAFVLGGGIDLGFGDPHPDALVFEFITDATGTFDLGLGKNANYGTCEQCVRIVQDLSGGVTKSLFAIGGKITIDPTTPPDGPNLDVTLQNASFAEVNIFADLHSEEIDGGVCYESVGAIDLSTVACVPSCGARVCGPDGCGGSCGAGCGDGATCTLDGSACETTPTCYQLTLPGAELDNRSAGVYQLDLTSHGLGALATRDLLQLEFYARATGDIDLAIAPNDDYASCTQCVRVVVDSKRDFFQQQGHIIINSSSSPIGDPDAEPPQGALSAKLVDVRLREVTYDADNHATPVAGGACIDLVTDDPFTKTLPAP